MKKVIKVMIFSVCMLIFAGSIAKCDSLAATNNKSGKPTWTVLFYLCGTDLETNEKYGSKTLADLCKAQINDNVNLVVQTGGCKKWSNTKVSADKAMRFEVKNNSLNEVWTGTKKSMGKPSTLTSFLKWSKVNYAADHTILVILDHGLGPVGGVISDTQFHNDSMTLPEMRNAFKAAKVHFDNVVFDTCITANLETADMLSEFSDYMQASEETSSGRGNEYSTSMTFLSEHLDCTIPELAKIQIDATQKMLATPLKGNDSWTVETDVTSFTQSVISLSKVKNVVRAFNAYGKKLVKLQKNKKSSQRLAKTIDKVKCYAQDDIAEYRTTYLDLGSLAKKTKQITSKESNSLLKEIKKAVVINKYGKYQKNSCGMYVYLPSDRTEKKEVKQYIKRASVSNNFSKFIKLYSHIH